MAFDLTMASATYDTSTQKFGSAALNGGAGRYTAPIITTSANDWTVECWVKRGSTPAGIEVCVAQYRVFWIGVDGSGYAQARYGHTNEQSLTGSTDICDGSWHHVALVFGANGAELFVDGVSIDTNATTFAASNPTFTYQFGIRFFYTATSGTAGGNGFGGSVDEVAVFNTEKYTSGFTPETGPYANDVANIYALYHLDSNGTDSAEVVDEYTADNAAFLYSPANWVTSGTDAITINAGSYVKTVFTGGTLNLLFTPQSDTQKARVKVFVDGIAVFEGETANASESITLPTETADYPKHLLEIVTLAISQDIDRWNNQDAGLHFGGIQIASGESIELPEANETKILYYGDSITEGTWARGFESAPRANDTIYHDGFNNHAYQLGKQLGAEIGVVAFSSQGVTDTGQGNVPDMEAAYDLVYSGQSRSFTGIDLVIINHGTNDNGASDAAVTTAYENILNALLTDLPSTANIVVLRPFGGYKWSAIQSAVTNIDSTRIVTIDTTGFFDTSQSPDSLHPYGSENIIGILPELIDALKGIVHGAPAAAVVGSVADTDLVPIQRGASTVHVEASDLKSYLAS